MATPLDACVAEVLRAPTLPTFSTRIQELLAIGAEDHTAHRRAALVLQDFGLTLRVLQVANSFQYNRSSRPIDDIARAIIVIGVRELRCLASELHLFDQFEKRSDALQRLMLLSMLTAAHASAVADAVGEGSQEEAHLLGLFRNLGEVLVACHWPRAYARLGQDAPSAVVRANAVRVLGFSYDTLALEVGEHWHFPPQVISLWSKKTSGATDLSTAIAQFGHDITTVIYRRSIGDVATKLQLLRQYGRRFNLPEEVILDIVESATNEIVPTLTQLALNIDHVRLGPTPAVRATA